jgi:DNA-directed RNA polymerase specialized sigma24 family protein
LVHSKVINEFRRQQRRPGRQLPAEELDLYPTAGGAAEADLDRQWQRQMVQAALRDLQAHDEPINYQVVALEFLEGHDRAEVGRRLGLTAKQLSYHRNRALAKLRDWIGCHTSADILIISQYSKP